jgi:hypothetical protein
MSVLEFFIYKLEQRVRGEQAQDYFIYQKTVHAIKQGSICPDAHTTVLFSLDKHVYIFFSF